MELKKVRDRLTECERVSGERVEILSKKYTNEREQAEVLERERDALLRDKDELIQEINKSTNNTNSIVAKMEHEFSEYKEKMSKELITVGKSDQRRKI